MKTILITVLDDEKADGMPDSDVVAERQWCLDHADEDGKIRAEIGVWLGQFIGKYRYRTSEWIKASKEEK